MLFGFRAAALVVLLAAEQAAAQSSCSCTCIADQCLTTVAGPKFAPSDDALSACRSYMWTISTVTDSTVTITSFSTSTVARSTDDIGTDTVTTTTTDTDTVTTTVTSGSTETETLLLQSDSGAAAKRRRDASLAKRQAKTIPAFATAGCPEPSMFSSACNCINITPGGTLYIRVNGTTTSTIPGTRTTTVDEVHSTTTSVTVTTNTVTTTTITSTVQPTVTVWIFRVAVGPSATPSSYRGQLWQLTADPPSPSLTRLAYAAASATAAAYLFRAEPDGTIHGINDEIFTADSIEQVEQLYLEPPPGSRTEVPCKFDLSTFGVTCSSPSGQNWVGIDQGSSKAVIFNTDSGASSTARTLMMNTTDQGILLNARRKIRAWMKLASDSTPSDPESEKEKYIRKPTRLLNLEETNAHQRLGANPGLLEIKAEQYIDFAEVLCEDAVWRLESRLIFDNLNHIPSDLFDDIIDDQNNGVPGYSFLTDERNAAIAGSRYSGILQNYRNTIAGTPPPRTTHEEEGKYSWNTKRKSYHQVRFEQIGRLLLEAGYKPPPLPMELNIEQYPDPTQYYIEVQSFLETIFCLLVATCPQVGEFEDIVRLSFVNQDAAMRNLRLEDGHFVVLSHVFEEDIPQRTVIPKPLSRLILIYLIMVRPFTSILGTEKEYEQIHWREDCLFPASNGSPWPMKRADRVLRRETKAKMGIDIGLNDFRAVYHNLKSELGEGWLQEAKYRLRGDDEERVEFKWSVRDPDAPPCPDETALPSNPFLSTKFSYNLTFG
ncbi:hypothetical protein Dda_0079 [Drechslerella dactyloides]|uniref:Uncharacterized protein n=1 Tax=Drechslerella dactyloides TaxID=74499 RepID=A0AAD6J527_DREDA|nr:hypothetical protein Dda_0079 [Drechslerella dactyloides]